MARTNLLALCCAAASLGGCASTALDRFVGGDMAAIVERYGLPTSHYNRPDGSKAFQWVISAKGTPAASAPLNMFLPVADAPLDARRRAAKAGIMLGGMCVYTVIGRWDTSTRRWRAVGYEPPRVDCD